MERKQFVVTDLTRMDWQDVCLAGIDTDGSLGCIRPELTSGSGRRALHPDERWLMSGIGQPVRLFSVVTVDTFGNRPTPPHVEDWEVSGKSPKVEPALDPPARRTLLESLQQKSIDELFGAPVSWNLRNDGLRSGGSVEPGSGSASLGTLRVDLLGIQVDRAPSGELRYRAYFRDEVGTYNRLSVSDLSFRLWADHLRRSNGGMVERVNQILREVFPPNLNAWLRIGLARPKQFESHSKPACYLQVTGVHTLPDYLDGAAWYDFR